MKIDEKLLELIGTASDTASVKIGSRLKAMQEIKTYNHSDVKKACEVVFNKTEDNHARMIVTRILWQSDAESALPMTLILLKSEEGFGYTENAVTILFHCIEIIFEYVNVPSSSI